MSFEEYMDWMQRIDQARTPVDFDNLLEEAAEKVPDSDDSKEGILSQIVTVKLTRFPDS